MKKLVFATNNEHKVEEIRNKLGGIFEISTLKEIGCTEEIPEDSGTLEGNALQKAHYLYNNYGCNCFADDTGLEVEILNKEPGVYSARYAGEAKDSEANMDKLLNNLKDKSNRNARFRTVIALIIDGKEYLFEGVAKGTIQHCKGARLIDDKCRLGLGGRIIAKGTADHIDHLVTVFQVYNTAPVVGDAHKGHTAVLNLNGDAIRSRVNRVLHQFLDDRRGTVNNLARRY